MIDNVANGNCSKGKKVAEVSASKRLQVRATNFSLFHEDAGPTHFYKVILAYVLELPPILIAFVST